MNKKISYGCLIFCMALYSVDTFAARRNTTRANTTTKTRSSSLVSGYSDKYFKSPSVTLVEKRSVELEPLMFTNNIANIKKTLNGSTVVDAKYRLCIPCENIYLTYNDGVINESLKGDNLGEGNCYSLNADTPNEHYKLAVKSGAIEACGEKLRMTILDVRNKDVHTEVDSVVLNIVPNSSLYDYSNIKLGQDTEIYELIDNYTEAKAAAKTACNDGIKSHLNAFKKALVGTTTVSAITTATGAADTALQIKNTIDEKDGKKTSGSSSSNTTNPPTTTLDVQKAKECWERRKGDKDWPNYECEFDCAQFTDEHKKEYCELREEACKLTKEECKKENTTTVTQNTTTTTKGINNTEIASAALSGASAIGNITTMAISISVAKQVDGLLDDLKKCKAAAEKMHAAGMALEAGLDEITSADE